MINIIFSVAALIFAVIYFVKGSRKQDAIFFRIYNILLVLSVLISAAVLKDELSKTFALCYGLIFCCHCALAVVKDLGKVLSFTLAAIVLVLNLPLLIDRVSGVGNFEKILNPGLSFTTAIVLLIMVFAKYTDKSVRKKEQAKENAAEPEATEK